MSLVVCGVTVLLSGVWRRAETLSGVAYVNHWFWCWFPAFWRSAACMDDRWSCLRYLSGLAVITADLEVLEGWLQNQRLLIITSLINLWAVGSDYLWLSSVCTYVRYLLPTLVGTTFLTTPVGIWYCTNYCYVSGATWVLIRGRWVMVPMYMWRRGVHIRIILVQFQQMIKVRG